MRDFDELVKLYQEDPEAFERERQEIIEDFINNIPEHCRDRVRQFQWKIDGELRKYKDPVARFNKMIELFWEGFGEFQDALNSCLNGTIPNKVKQQQHKEKAPIISIQRINMDQKE